MTPIEISFAVGLSVLTLWGTWLTKNFLAMRKEVGELHNWHDVPDPTRPGAMAWYDQSDVLRKELIQERKEVKDILREQTLLLRKILEKE